ncbi:MAG: cupin [Candidatus Binatia bacterium]|nr:MAG: cupin [Candidatus Binatia bacterium]
MRHWVSVEESVAFRPDKLCKVNLFESPRMFCDVYGLEPGQSQGGHVHEGSDKVYFVVSGEGRFQVGTEEQTAGAGTAVFAPAGTLHSVANPGPDRLVLLVFMAPKP